jgi:rod shape-determining protein MreC
MKPIFKGGIPRLFFLILVVVSIVFMITDNSDSKAREAKSYLSLLLTPIQWLVDLPSRMADDVSDVLVSRRSLAKENEQLRSDVISLDQQVQQMASLTAENIRLRELLNGRERIPNEVKLAELIGVNPDPFQHQIILGKGSEDDVFIGQPVLDAGGVLGQVVEVSHYTCRVMLITDARHALPVEIIRNGFRSIALGKGTMGELELEHVPDTADVREGDLLVTSGLGKRFPYGYPVAQIVSVVRDPGQPFAIVKAVPSARLDKSRHLLLVEPAPIVPEEPTEFDMLETPEDVQSQETPANG